MEPLLFIGLIVSFFLIANLRKRVRELEQHGIVKSVQHSQVTAQTAHTAEQQQPSEAQVHEPVSDELRTYVLNQLAKGVSVVEIQNALRGAGWTDAQIQSSLAHGIEGVQPAAPGNDAMNRFAEWLKEEWLLKLGAALLLVGFGWLTTYAFANNWIGPAGRIGLGFFGGILFLVSGWQRIKTHIHQGGVFLVLGSTIILLTTFAARAAYDFFTPGFALFVMFLSTAFVALSSVQHKSKALAVGSLALAGIAPLLTDASHPNFIGLFAYLFVVVLGAIWVVALTGQRILTTVALVIVALHSLPHLFSFTNADRGALLLFAYAFVIVFFFTNTIGILRARGQEIKEDLITAMGNGLFLLAWVLIAAGDEWKSLIIAAWMIVFMAGAFAIFKATQRKEPFFAYAGVGIAMLAAATATELSGAALTIAYTIESALVVYIGYAVLRDISIVQKLSYLLIGPILLSLGSVVSRSWRDGVFHEDFFVLFLLSLSLLLLGGMFFVKAKQQNDSDLMMSSAQFLVVGSVYAYVLLWLSLNAGLASYSLAVMLSLVIYTIIGLTAYFYGLAHEQKGLKIYGGVLVGFVVGRLLLVDVWSMEMAGRIVTFFLIGTLLISTAFLSRKSTHENTTLNT